MEPFSPVFLLCSERSGSNLIVRLLDSHPDFCGPPPSHLIRTLALNLSRFGDLRDDAAWRRVLDISARILQHQLGIWHGTWDVATLEDAVEERSIRGIIKAIYSTEFALQGKRGGIIKENRIHSFLPYLMAAFPAARYVWMTREPKDMALSWKHSSNHPGDVRQGTKVWLEDQRNFRQIHASLRPFGTVHHLRYEDIITTPQETLEGLCAFLNVPYSPQMLDFHSKEETKANAARIQNWENLSKPLLAENLGKYRTGLSETEIRFIEATCQEEMRALGNEIVSPDLPSAEQARAELTAAFGQEDMTLRLKELDAREQRIREGRQRVIDDINQLPVSLY
ncbi:MAG: sulfotransferase [Alphaproteobacteria bacterium]|nr:sulfotransferase [Alphaproteobacteria bacterium]